MDLEQTILMKMQSEINKLIVKRDLKCLPKVVYLLKKYISLQKLSDEDILELTKLSKKYDGLF